MAEMEKAKSLDSTELNKSEEDAIAATQAQLNALGIEGSEQAEETESTPEEKPEVKEENQETQADEVDSTPASKLEGKENTEEVSLPDAYFRAAEHQGWKPEEITEFFKATPELAIQTLGKIHESTNKLSDDFANIGRAKLKPADKPVDAATAAEAVAAGKKVDLAALKEELGADSVMFKTIEAIQASIPAPTVSTGQPVQNQPIVQQNVALDPRVEVMVNQFFTADTLKPYKDFYGEGKDINKLTMEQNQRRWAVLDRADDIAEGAAKMGRPVTPDEAMDLAHMLISADVQKQAVRAELKATIVKRSKGLSLKPAQSKTALPVKDEKTTAADLEAKVEAGMRKIKLL